MSLNIFCDGEIPAPLEIVDQLGGCSSGDLLAIDKLRRTVTWYSPGAVRVKRKYIVSKMLLDAKFCRFPTTSYSGGDSGSGRTSAKRAIAVLMGGGCLQLFMLTGEAHEIQLPCYMMQMISCSCGLVFQRDQLCGIRNNNTDVPPDTLTSPLRAGPSFFPHMGSCPVQKQAISFYWLEDPNSPVKPALIYDW